LDRTFVEIKEGAVKKLNVLAKIKEVEDQRVGSSKD
jgi:hypothetical protein